MFTPTARRVREEYLLISQQEMEAPQTSATTRALVMARTLITKALRTWS
jgi:hypothetical protein